MTGTARAVLAWLLTGTVATAALAASDQVARFIVTAEFGSQAGFARKLGAVVDWSGVGTPALQVATAGALLLVFGLIGILLIVVLWFELLLRNAAIAILVATSPIAAAGQVSDATKAWWSRTVAATVQLMILKPVIALVFAVGFGMAGDSAGVTGILQGLLVLGLAAFAWPVIARFFTFATIQAADSGLGALLGLAAGTIASRGGGGTAGVPPDQLGRDTEARVMGGGGGSGADGGATGGGGRRWRGGRRRGVRAGEAAPGGHAAGRADGADRRARRDARRLPVLDDLRRAADRAPRGAAAGHPGGQAQAQARRGRGRRGRVAVGRPGRRRRATGSRRPPRRTWPRSVRRLRRGRDVMAGHEAPGRAYGGWQPERVNFLFGLSGRRAAILAAAILAALLPVAATDLREAAVTWPAAIAVALAATVRVQGRTADEWAAGGLSWLAIRAQGQHRFAGGPYTPASAPVQPGDDPNGPLMELPGILAPLRILAVPSGGSGDLAVVHHALDRTYTAVARVRVPGIALADSGCRDQRVDGWGALLAGLCTEGSPVIRIQALQRAVPEPGVLLRTWHDDHVIAGAPALAGAVASQLLGTAPATACRREAYVAVTMDGHRARSAIKAAGGGDAGAAAVLVRHLRALTQVRSGALPDRSVLGVAVSRCNRLLLLRSIWSAPWVPNLPSRYLRRRCSCSCMRVWVLL